VKNTDIVNYKTQLNIVDINTENQTKLKTFNKSVTEFKSKLQYNFTSRYKK